MRQLGIHLMEVLERKYFSRAHKICLNRPQKARPSPPPPHLSQPLPRDSDGASGLFVLMLLGFDIWSTTVNMTPAACVKRRNVKPDWLHGLIKSLAFPKGAHITCRLSSQTLRVKRCNHFGQTLRITLHSKLGYTAR